MPSSPRVSVLLPSYLCAHHIDDAIASVIQQSLSDFELLICDDHSTDESRQVAQAWAKRDARIALIDASERGVVAALNAMYAQARGEYIALLGPKDRFAQHHLQTSVTRLDAEPKLVGVFSAVEVCNDRGDPRPTLQGHMAAPSDTSCEGAALAKRLVAGNCLQMPTALLRKSATDKLDIFVENYQHAHAWSLWLRLSLEGDLAFVNERGARSLVQSVALDGDRQKLESFESLALIEMVTPKVVQRYNLGDDTWGRLHGVMAAHAMLAQQPQRALVHFATKAKHEGLNESEKICLMQCLAATGRVAPARDLAVLLHAERYTLKPETCEALDATSRAMGWDLYATADNAGRSEQEMAALQPQAAEGPQLPAP